MSLQCVPWPSIQRHGPVEAVLPKPLEVDFSRLALEPTVPPAHLTDTKSFDQFLDASVQNHGLDLNNTVFEEPMTSTISKASEESEGFEDDFAPFVSGEPGTFDPPMEEPLIPDSQLEEIERLIFGHSSGTGSNGETGFELGDVLSRLDDLKASAQHMNDHDRREFAAGIALAVERHLEFG